MRGVSSVIDVIEFVVVSILWIGAIYCGLAIIYNLMQIGLDLLGYDLTITRREENGEYE